jgi:hypothetical protein
MARFSPLARNVVSFGHFRAFRIGSTTGIGLALARGITVLQREFVNAKDANHVELDRLLRHRP